MEWDNGLECLLVCFVLFRAYDCSVYCCCLKKLLLSLTALNVLSLILLCLWLQT